MSAIDIVIPRLQTEEGFRAAAYKDREGHLTIGYGFNVDAGITRTAALALMRTQVQELDIALNGYVWYSGLDAVRQSVCLDIGFNDGLPGLLKFPHMIVALANKDWQTAADECRVTNSELAGRYAKLAQILLTGVAS
jgi:lysozyme